ncbi:MAG TPA: Hsp70 family protein, partial [Vicinamibacterales bacterium]
AEEDKRRREEVETRNRADQAIYAAEAFLRESADKVPDDVRRDLDSAVNTLKGALDRNDADAIRRGLDELTKAQHKAAEALYRTASATGPSTQPDGGADTEQSGAAGGGPGEGVIDAEVVDEGKN